MSGPDDYDPSVQPHEMSLTIVGTEKMVVFPTAEAEPDGVSYVRVLSASGDEIGYWVYDEWAEAPEEVMGALLGALSSMRE